MKRGICSTSGCDIKTRCKGLCANCYSRKIRRAAGQPQRDSVEFKESFSLAHRKGLSSIDPYREISKDGKSRSIAVKVVSRIRHHAIQRNYDWSISDVHAYELIVGSCVYCGIESGWPKTRNSIDRVDSLIGYVSGNCVSSCLPCNKAKREKPFSDLLVWAKRFSDYNKF